MEVPAGVVPLLLAAVLVAYNTVTNLWIPGDRWYVPRNVAVAAGLVVFAHDLGLTWRDLGLGSDAVGTGLRWGAGIVVAVTITLSLGVAVAERVRWIGALLSDRRADLTDRALAWHVLVRIPIGTAAFEEVAFRGVLLGVLLDRAGTLAAVVGSAVAFGLWHVGPTLAALDENQSEGRLGRVVAAVLATTVAGLVLAVGRLELGLVAVGIAHWATNAMGLLAATVFQRTSGPSGPGSSHVHH